MWRRKVVKTQNLEKSYVFVELKKMRKWRIWSWLSGWCYSVLPCDCLSSATKRWVAALWKHVKHRAHIQVMAIFWHIYEQQHIAAKFHRVMTHQRISWISTCFHHDGCIAKVKIPFNSRNKSQTVIGHLQWNQQIFWLYPDLTQKTDRKESTCARHCYRKKTYWNPNYWSLLFCWISSAGTMTVKIDSVPIKSKTHCRSIICSQSNKTFTRKGRQMRKYADSAHSYPGPHKHWVLYSKW